jgi:hypothetical protein
VNDFFIESNFGVFFGLCLCEIPIKGRMELLQLPPAWDSLFLAMRSVGKRETL